MIQIINIGIILASSIMDVINAYILKERILMNQK